MSSRPPWTTEQDCLKTQTGKKEKKKASKEDIAELVNTVGNWSSSWLGIRLVALPLKGGLRLLAAVMFTECCLCWGPNPHLQHFQPSGNESDHLVFEKSSRKKSRRSTSTCGGKVGGTTGYCHHCKEVGWRDMAWSPTISISKIFISVNHSVLQWMTINFYFLLSENQ